MPPGVLAGEFLPEIHQRFPPRISVEVPSDDSSKNSSPARDSSRSYCWGFFQEFWLGIPLSRVPRLSRWGDRSRNAPGISFGNSPGVPSENPSGFLSENPSGVFFSGNPSGSFFHFFQEFLPGI